MRVVGGAQHAGGLGVHDHLSWPYEDRADFVRRVEKFVGDGLALGLGTLPTAEYESRATFLARRSCAYVDPLESSEPQTKLADPSLQEARQAAAEITRAARTGDRRRPGARGFEIVTNAKLYGPRRSSCGRGPAPTGSPPRSPTAATGSSTPRSGSLRSTSTAAADAACRLGVGSRTVAA